MTAKGGTGDVKRAPLGPAFILRSTGAERIELSKAYYVATEYKQRLRLPGIKRPGGRPGLVQTVWVYLTAR